MKMKVASVENKKCDDTNYLLMPFCILNNRIKALLVVSRQYKALILHYKVAPSLHMWKYGIVKMIYGLGFSTRMK